MNLSVMDGFLTKDPELRFTKGGTAVASVDIGVNEGFGDKVKVTFFTIILWKKKAEYICNYAKKGDHILVQGRNTIRAWENTEGKKQYKYECVAEEVKILSKKNKAQESQPGPIENEPEEAPGKFDDQASPE